MRYISKGRLVMFADGDPWAVNSTLQTGRPAQIADLAQAFHDAGQSTNEAQTAFGQARELFEQSWYREDGHRWKRIAVTQNDIDTDISQHGASWLDNGQPNAALWPSVLESAYAKLKYPGQSLAAGLSNETGIGQGGQTKDALEALTGNRGTNNNPGSVWLTNQHIDSEIRNALTNHQPVTISTTPNGAPLVESHAYIVESITGTGSDARVTLRNPWEFNPGDPDNPLITVRLGDLIGSGLADINIPGIGEIPSGPLGKLPTYDVNIGSLG